jgi:rhamnose transport system substrate-binding protein
MGHNDSLQRQQELTLALQDGRISRAEFVRRSAKAGASFTLIGALLAACGSEQQGGGGGGSGESANEPAALKVFFVPKFTGFSFFEQGRDGGKVAVKELGVRSFNFNGPDKADVQQQVQIVQNILPQKPDVLVIAALDIDAVSPSLRQAREQGAVVVTYDADVTKDARDLFTNMMAFPTQAEAMLDCALANQPDGGKAIWVAPTPTTANFISQKKAIDEQIAKERKYQRIDFVKTLYANDDPTKSYQVAVDAMESYKDLKLFVSGSGVSVPAMNKAIEATGKKGKVYATGYGLPNTMETYLKNGTCKQVALWDPKEFGYLATYAGISIKTGKLDPKPGTVFRFGSIGKRKVQPDVSINLDRPLFYTAENVSRYDY